MGQPAQVSSDILSLTRRTEAVMGFPVIFEHKDACAVLRGKHVKASAIAAAAVILVSRGADEILVPAPSTYERERAAEGIELLPRERRPIVKLIDRDGSVLRQVRDYLAPLKSQAGKWPETAFVHAAEGFLYQLALGARRKAGILDDVVQSFRGFVPIVNPQLLHGEARFRLAELSALVCSYEPECIEHGAYRIDRACEGSSLNVWKVLNTAEFRSVISASGRLGYLKHPRVALKRVRDLMREFLARPDAKKLLTLANTTAELAGAGKTVDTLSSIAEQFGASGDGRPFHPPFISLGPAGLGVYRVTLAEALIGAVPPDGTIVLYERSRGGIIGHEWVNTGEENKRQLEARSTAYQRRESLLKARAAQKTLLKN